MALGDLVPELKAIKDAVINRARLYFIDKAFQKKTRIIDEWKAQDIYPYAGDTGKDPTTSVERKVFDILAVNVQSYLKNFEKSDKKTKKFTFMLLSQAIKQNPASVQKIITEVLELKAQEQDELAEMLESTSLSSIISASKIVADRLNFINGLDNLVHDRETKKHSWKGINCIRFWKGRLGFSVKISILQVQKTGLKKSCRNTSDTWANVRTRDRTTPYFYRTDDRGASI
ncbi:hypothetical protein [Candidatus Pantoea bituminis]|uniref:hypothetical protein n=1 Tax=Candidatus Pantoea bituminis TaxID=2831036 RepID=UPI001C061A5B|nr:hypothetical protein [Pantoea bituminis]